MANIDNLHFEVILKDENFRQRVAEDIELANKLNTSLSDALNFNKKVKIEPLKRVKQTFDDIEKSSKRSGKTMKEYNVTLRDSNRLMKTLGQLTGVSFSVVGVRRFLSTLIDITGQFEVQKMALRNMLQDIDGANKIFEDLYNFSSKSTYRFSELAKYAKQLAAFNIEQESLLETTKMLGDVASGVGVSMDRVILAYGHVKSSGFLRGIQLRSFSQNGIPVLEELAKMLTEVEGKTVSLGDVFDKMMKREITFEMVEEAFKRMTSEGGKFYQMQEVLAKTLAGQINILKGKWENLMYAMGESQEGILKGVVQAMTRIVSSTESFGNAIKTAVVILGSWKAAALVAALATDTLTASQIRLLSVSKQLWAVVSNPLALVGAAAAATIGAIVKAEHDANSELKETVKLRGDVANIRRNYISALSEENDELDRLYARLNKAKEGTEEYNAARRAIETRFAPYISQLQAEGVEVSNLAYIYTQLADKIKDASKQRFLQTTQETLLSDKEGAMKNIDAEFEKLVRRINKRNGAKLTMEQQQNIWSYITGEDYTSTIGGMYDILRQREKGITANNLAFENYTFAQQVEKLRRDYGATMDAFEDGMMEAARLYETTVTKITETTTGSVEFSIDQIVSQIKQIDAQLAQIRSKPGLGTADEETIKGLEQDREDWTKMYKTLMGVDYDKSAKSAQADANKAAKDRIQSLKAEISVLEKYMDAREKLEPYFGDQTNMQLARLFGARDYNSLDSDIQRLIDELRSVGEEGAQAADQIEARLGTDALGALLGQQQKLKKYGDTLASWLGQDFSHDGTGVEYKAGRLAAKYNEAVIATQKKFNDAVRQAKDAHHGNAAAIAAEVEKLKALRDEELAYHAAQRDEGIASLAGQVYKDATQGLNLKDWAHKTIGELENIQEALNNLELPAWVHQIFEHNPEGFEKFVSAFRSLVGADSDKATEQITEEKLENFRKYAQYASALADSLMELGDALGDPSLSGLGEVLGFITDTASAVFERLAKGDIIGAIVAGIASALKHIGDSIAASARMAAEIRAAAEEIRRAGLSDMLSNGVESVFGSNEMAKVENAVSAMGAISKHAAAIGRSTEIHYKKGFWDNVTFGLARHKGSVADLAAELGADLYDAYGNLNADTLRAILDTYKGLKQSEKEWIEQAINDSEAYADAMEQLNGVVQSVFGQIASSSSDAIVEQWKKRGDAALDYADILDDVATRYAKMMIESAILDEVLDEKKAARIVDMFMHGNAEGAMEQIANDMATIQAMAPVWEQILEAFDPYFNRSDTGSDTLRDGINKELVEGNSSLIASYINAMRADLSVLRQMQTSGWTDVRFIRETMPTLADHVARIEANTYDNAQNTSAILGKLQSIITPSTNGGSAVRTTK